MTTAYLLAIAFGVFLFAGVGSYAAGAVTWKSAHTGYLGDDWHRRERRRAYRWFAVCAVCWLSVVGLWLAVR